METFLDNRRMKPVRWTSKSTKACTEYYGEVTNGKEKIFLFVIRKKANGKIKMHSHIGDNILWVPYKSVLEAKVSAKNILKEHIKESIQEVTKFLL